MKCIVVSFDVHPSKANVNRANNEEGDTFICAQVHVPSIKKEAQYNLENYSQCVLWSILWCTKHPTLM